MAVSKFLGIHWGSDGEGGSNYADIKAQKEHEYRQKATKGAVEAQRQSFSLASGKLPTVPSIQSKLEGAGVELERSGVSSITREEMDILSKIMTSRIKDISTRRSMPGRSQMLLANRGL